MTRDYPEREGEYTASDVRAWREGDWVLIELAGRVRYRRLSRDRAFITARVKFYSNQSPRKPRKEETLERFEIRVQPPRAGDGHYKNFIDVPIETGGH